MRPSRACAPRSAPSGGSGSALTVSGRKRLNHLGEMVDLLALGPLELWHQGRQYTLGSLKERCVLGILLYSRGDPVSVDTLVERVWDDDDLPAAPVEALRTYLSRLRTRLHRAVGDDALVERAAPRRYRLRVEHEDDVDFVRLEQLRAQARAAAGRGDTEYAVGLLHAAQALWRGEPFAEFTGAWAASARARLTEDHRRVREERIRLELELGRHADLVGELHELVSLDPLAQQAVAALMLALYRSGRDGEALALYRETHGRLADELGIDPGVDLQDLHHRVLRQDPVLREPAPRDPAPVALAVPAGSGEAPEQVPAESGEESSVRDPGVGDPRRPTGAADKGPVGSSLPRDTRDFTGRGSELEAMLAATVSSPEGNGTALPLTVVHGMPGVGKSALIIHAAYRMRSRYPAGQFYVDLRGYSDQPPYEPADALAFLLHTVGVPDPLPETLDERTARWREWTAYHRVLVVLDNARDAEQVRPLLPGSPECHAIVASRNRLAGLDGAMSVPLDVLSVSEAASLFARIVGAARVSDTSALRRVVELCSCHPLTVQLLASRFRHRDTWDLEYVADRLTRAGDRLDEFDRRVAAAFQLSYSDLDASARLLFRHLALHPGPDITLEAATALCGGPDTEEIRRAADDLLDRHLLNEPVRDRYQLHDLARAFGGRLCRAEDPPTARDGALRRLMSYYLTAADRADRLAYPRRRRRPIGQERFSSCAPDFTSAEIGPGPEAESGPEAGPGAEAEAVDAASAWLTLERANLLAVARTAAADFPDFAPLFPHVLAYALKLWGVRDLTAEFHAAALAALRVGDDHQALAQTLVERADVLAQENHGEALHCAAEALSLFEELDDVHGRADALFEIGRAHLAAGRGEMSLHELDRALALYQQVGDRYGVAESLNVQGAALIFGAEYARAMHRFRAMLEIHRDLRNAHGQVKALNNMGEIYFAEGLYEEARSHYEQSLALARRFGGRQELAILDTNLGTVHRVTGRPELALVCFRRALASHRASEDAVGEVNALNSLGAACAESGRMDEALRHFSTAERVSRRIDNQYERQRALVGIADTQRTVGQLGVALETYGSALRIAEKFGFPLGSAHALAGLARTHLHARGIDSARPYAERALALYQRLGAAVEAEELRCLLASWGATGS
ncbi:DNA-binding SARP family transcriptional activator/Tfp pilus assembly protein PilF [Streptomyces umbrinus]|uniref:DNA-binding SARP family transcriptional activator/Tfp pilus assembly protein PilF n=2 Tax=Streptomyces umbrinus TaxID=67370 RepID=A0ABU0SWL2_9ACTN|nr:DNA-binding SARP family transcriptional activator/Tfp pilus assembly protein PilF [Streptomyces umbrinus]